MERLKLTGLWKNVGKQGKAYYSGNLTPTTRLLVFKNEYKESDRAPDLVVYLVPAEKREGANDA